MHSIFLRVLNQHLNVSQAFYYSLFLDWQMLLNFFTRAEAFNRSDFVINLLDFCFVSFLYLFILLINESKAQLMNWSSKKAILSSIPKSTFVCSCNNKFVTHSPTFLSRQSIAIFHRPLIPSIALGSALTITSTVSGSVSAELPGLKLYDLNWAPVQLL